MLSSILKDIPLFSAKTTSFFPYDSTRTLWGNASYKNQELRKVRWNESVDSDLLYPYFTADAVGGDLHSEQYAFMGGFANNGNDCIGVSVWITKPN